MGCSQSKQRTEIAADRLAPIPAKVSPLAVVAAAVVPHTAVATEHTPEVDASEATAAEIAPIVAVEPIVKATAVEASVEEPETAAADVTEAPAAQPSAFVVAVEAEVEVPKPVAAIESEIVASAPAMPEIPLLVLSSKPLKSAVKAKKSVPTSSRKENVAVTPSKAAAKTSARRPAFGERAANTSVPSFVVADTVVKCVAFSSLPAAPSRTQAAAARKQKVIKTAGKHFHNLQEEMFLASVAACERQLTHRATLDKHLNTR